MVAQHPPRARFLWLLAVAFLVVQIAIPAVALFGARPSRFGWHMYSALPPVPEVTVVKVDGATEIVDLGTLFVVPRAEIDYQAALRRRLCAVSGAEEIRLRLPGEEVERLPCT
jgi:hypothetical protein